MYTQKGRTVEERTPLEDVDTDIQQRARAGDVRGAWLLAYEVYWERIFQACCTRLSGWVEDVADAAWDVTADTFVAFRVFAARHQGAWPGPARAYLYTMARNHCIDLLRRRYRSPIDAQATRSETCCATPEPTPEQAMLHQQAQAHLADAIRQLPPIYRDVVNARLTLELSFEEIATMLDISVGNVRTRLTRALQILRTRVAHER